MFNSEMENNRIDIVQFAKVVNRNEILQKKKNETKVSTIGRNVLTKI